MSYDLGLRIRVMHKQEHKQRNHYVAWKRRDKRQCMYDHASCKGHMHELPNRTKAKRKKLD